MPVEHFKQRALSGYGLTLHAFEVIAKPRVIGYKISRLLTAQAEAFFLEVKVTWEQSLEDSGAYCLFDSREHGTNFLPLFIDVFFGASVGFVELFPVASPRQKNVKG